MNLSVAALTNRVAPLSLSGATMQPAPSAPAAADTLPAQAAPQAQGRAGWKLWNEQTATRAIVDAIDGAEHVVNAEFFGISDGGKGAHIVDALERAARRGVEVNVFADAISMSALPVGSYFTMKRRIEDAGGTVMSNFRLPVVRDHDDTPARKNVDHRKVVTIDGDTAFVGGINFIKLEDDFRDSMVQLSGVNAARLAADQLDRWRRVGGTVTERHEASVRQALDGAQLVPSDPTEMRVVANAPEQQRYELTDGYRELIRGAKERIWISSPGYSDQELIEELNAAARRGVDVRLIAPGKDPLGIPIINWVGRSHLRELVGHGATAYEIPEVLHRKALVADDEVIFSSFNITGRSKQHLHEVGVRTKDPEFVDAIATVLEQDMQRSRTVDESSGGTVGRVVGDFIAQRLKLNY